MSTIPIIPDEAVVAKYLSFNPTRRRGQAVRPHFTLVDARRAFSSGIQMSEVDLLAVEERYKVRKWDPKNPRPLGELVDSYTSNSWGQIYEWDGAEYVVIENIPKPQDIERYGHFSQYWRWVETRPWVLEQQAKKSRV